MAGAEAEVWAALEQGGLLLTSQARLSRGLRESYDSRQLATGRQAWPAPGIATLREWCERTWAEAGDRVCLSGAQEALLWERAIVAVAGELDWLDVAATAAAAARAWRLAQEWMLPLTGPEWAEAEDCAAFQKWAREFQRRCDQGDWITAAEVPARLAEYIAAERIAVPAEAWLAGFDVLNPQQEKLRRALEQAGTRVRLWESDAAAAEARVEVCSDSDQELRAAAEWARGEIEAGSTVAGLPVAVILPDLGTQRAAVERAFDEVFEPRRAPWSEAARAFHVSLGAPLAQVPLVDAALRCAGILGLAEPLELAPVLEWIRLPYLAGGDSEAAERAYLERRLRGRRRAHWRWEDVRREATEANCGVLAACLQRTLRVRQVWPRRQSYADWAAGIGELWAAAGWPGERDHALGSHDYQARVAFERLLDQFAALDQVAGPAAWSEALARLERMAAGRIFQPEAAPAPVQVMGWLEAAGQCFKAVRVCGLHDAAVPGAARPHPFLPLRLQRTHGLPHATAAGEAEFAARVWRRLRGSSPRLLASYAAADSGGRPQQASPLLTGLASAEYRWPAVAVVAAEMVTGDDGQAPECLPGERHGGSSLLREQSLCPFRAFAHLRLGARGSEAMEPGLDAATRGTLVHALLRDLWQWLQSQERLQTMPEGDLRAGVGARAAAVVAAESRLAGQPALAALERERLTGLAMAWLRVEGERKPFRIRALEADRECEFAGLDLRLKLDRVDELEGGERVIVDYKTGDAQRSEWLGWRPRNPQLPLYLITDPQREEVAALTFGRVRAGDMGWAGRERTAHELQAGGKPATIPQGWAAQVAEWQATLERLAKEYERGVAVVDPLPLVCDECDLHALCRIHEREVRAPYPEEDGEEGDD